MQNATTASKTVIITGANSGLGYQCAKAIANSELDWHIIIASRSSSRVEEAAQQLMSETFSRRLEVLKGWVMLLPDSFSIQL